jgi:bacterioferritin-associated ferredoxin
MYVCHCHVVTDRDIVESIANGARCIADLARATGAGRTCGGCVPTMRDLVSGPGRSPAFWSAEGEGEAGQTVKRNVSSVIE